MSATPRDVTSLRDVQPPCVSVFATLEGRGTAGEHDQRRVARLLDDATAALQDHGMPAPDADTVVAPARSVLDDAPWPHVWGGLALYLAPGTARWFGLRDAVGHRVVVGEKFVLAPLVREAEREDQFWLLALSRNLPRLFYGDGDTLVLAGGEEARLPTFDEVVGVDDAEATLQFHRGSGGTARSAATYHGHGGTKDADEDRVQRWLRAVADRVEAVLQVEPAPLVLAGVAEELAVFRDLLDDGPVVEDEYTGSPDRVREADLHSQASTALARHLDQHVQGDRARYVDHDGSGWTVSITEDVARAAREGRVDVLFASEHPPAELERVVDDTVLAVWETGGTVHVVHDVPGSGPLAGILRYVTAVAPTA